MTRPSLSIVIPVYNSEQILPILLERLNSVLGSLSGRYEVILVNDGSRDRSAETMDRLALRYQWLQPIHLMRNYGQHNALLCGIRKARNEVVVTMDDDLQNPPEEIEKLLRKLAEGYDAVYGYPEQESHGWLRDMASKITKISLRKAMGVETANRVSSFRAFRTQLRDVFCEYRGAFVSIDVLLGWGTTRFAAVPVRNPPRTLGASNYTISRLIAHALNMMTGFSTLPLQLASILGFTFSLFGLGVMIFVVGRYLMNGGSVPGFPFLASIFSIFSGVQLFCLGILGEYLARMHFRMMDKPTYAIRQHRVGQTAKSAAAVHG